MESIPISSVCMLTVTLKEQMSVPIYLKLNINFDIPLEYHINFIVIDDKSHIYQFNEMLNTLLVFTDSY